MTRCGTARCATWATPTNAGATLTYTACPKHILGYYEGSPCFSGFKAKQALGSLVKLATHSLYSMTDGPVSFDAARALLVILLHHMTAHTPSSDLACLQAHREAFAAWLPLGGVPLSYAIAIGYVLVDTADKGVKAFQMAQQELGGNAALHPEVDTPKCAAPRPPPAEVMPRNVV